MTATMLFEEALKLSLEEQEILYGKLDAQLHGQASSREELKLEMQRRIKDAMEHAEEGQTLQEWRDEILATRGLRL
jgi:hypothetical protein